MEGEGLFLECYGPKYVRHVAGTLWNLSSHDSIKMAIVDHALHALTDEVIIPRSGWEREPNEDSKPRHMQWESVLTNTAGCLRYEGSGF